jgi:N,N'-diacetyllegionaminate synthase
VDYGSEPDGGWRVDGMVTRGAGGFAITTRRVGGGAPCFVIAEAGVNHNGDLDLARQLVDVAAAAGADAVKFQTFRAARLATAAAPKAAYQAAQDTVPESQLEMLQRLEMPESWYPELIARCEKVGLVFLSTPFEEESADALAALGMAAFKVPSGELTNLPFLAHLARLGRPMIVSTGMSVLDEVDAALETIRRAGDPPVVLLHCVSRYPTPIDDANVHAMVTLAEAFDVPVGYSDHTEGIEASLAAVALGAVVVEKHFTLDRGLPGPDHQASLEPTDLTDMVRRLRLVERSLGTGEKRPSAQEQETAAVARKSLVLARAVPAGHTLHGADLAIRRPGTGLPPSAFAMVVGRQVARALPADHLLSPDDFMAEDLA